MHGRCVAATIDAAQKDVWQLGVEVAMLIGPEVADDTLTDSSHALRNADLLLNKGFALVLDRQHLQDLARVPSPKKRPGARSRTPGIGFQAAARPTGV